MKHFILIGFLFSIGVVHGYIEPPHPLRLSLCEVEYFKDKKELTVSLKLFLTDVNEALVFDPNSTQLGFCTENESENAEELLLNYLNSFFYIKLNDKNIPLKISRKKLSGEGENTALWIYFNHDLAQPLNQFEIKNAVFTDLFFDQNNICYLHFNNSSKSIMLNKKSPIYNAKI